MFIPLQFNKANLQRLLTALGTYVTSFSAGTTGLTPNTATTGAVTLAGTLNAANGGTGIASYAIGDVLYASGAITLSKLADVVTGNALISGGVTTAPSWGKIGLTTHVSGTLGVGNGGSGATTFTAHGVLLGNAASAFAVTAVGTTGQILTGVSGADPVWGSAPVNQSTTGPTTQNLTSGSGATYTTPAGVKWIKARYVGGGGGGGGVGLTTDPAGATGGTTIFNSVNAVGGSGGLGATNSTGAGVSTGGAGGTGGSGTATMRFPGNGGGSGVVSNGGVTSLSGGGAPSLFGGGVPGVPATATTGTSATANTGAGGAGGTATLAATQSAGGGGSGEYVELIISNPAGTYTYTIGAGGAGGIGTGTGATTGGAGGSGWITVEEHYNYG